MRIKSWPGAAVAVVAIAAVTAVVAVWRSGDGAVARHGSAFDVRPGLPAQLFVPAPAPSHAPLVVLVPGGGWTSADPAGLVSLAERLAASGVATATTTYRVGTDASRFPIPVSDVNCAVDAAVAAARTAGVTPTRVVVLGHSAGAQLAAMAALTGSRFRGDCAWPQTRIDALIGLAGPYDIARFSDVAQPLVGTNPRDDPAHWHDANPLTWTALRPDLPALLAYGTADSLVPPTFTTGFADALRRDGHQVQVLPVDGATHASIYQADVIASPILDWLGRPSG